MANAQHLAVAAAHYSKGGFARRVKGQSFAQAALPTFLFEQSGGLVTVGGPGSAGAETTPLPGWSVELLGTGPGVGPGSGACQYDHLVVTTAAGARYPAQRIHDQGGTQRISQCRDYLPA